MSARINPVGITEAVRAILNAPAPGVALWEQQVPPCGADCARCRSSRDEGEYDCKDCGYHGAPLVSGCSCLKEGRPEKCEGPSKLGGCSHGTRSCPVCMEASDNEPGEYFDPLDMIRAIRAVVDTWPIPSRPVGFDPNDPADAAIYRAEDAVQLLKIAEADVYQSVTDLQAVAETLTRRASQARAGGTG